MNKFLQGCHGMKWMSVILSLLVAGGWLARAEPTDQENHSDSLRIPTTLPQGRSREADNPSRRPLAGAAPTTQQIKEAEEFLKAKSPNRYHAYEKLMADGRQHPFIQKGMVNGYWQLHLLQNQDLELYQMKLDELALEDKMLGIVSDAHEGGQKPDRQLLREQLRQTAHDLVDKRKQEAQYRIDRMQRAVDKERLNLEKLQTDDATARVIEQEIDSVGRLPLGIIGGGPNARPVPPRLNGNPTTHSVDADESR
jgi:hypothetical protein